MNISGHWEGVDRLLGALGGVTADLSDLRPGWRAVSDEIYSTIRQVFRTVGGSLGARWPARAASTVARAAAINRRGFTLLNETGRATDKMFVSLTTRGAPGGVYEERPDSLTMGSDVHSERGFHYPAAFHGGTSRQPARPVFAFTEGIARRLLSMVKRGLLGKAKDRGFDYVDDGGGAAF